MKNVMVFGLMIIWLLVGCGGEETAVSSPTPHEPGMGSGMMGGGMMGGGMMARHNAPIPDTYAGLTNPATATDEALAHGGELYTLYCASCHGDGGMGDGPAAANLDPAPAPIAHTSRMLGDDYLFWRISEGGSMAPFNSVMPAWGAALSESDRWDVILYVRALGSDAMPDGMGMGMGGGQNDPAAAATRHADMLAQGVEQDVITQAEADLFARIHDLIESQMTNTMQQMQGNMGQMQDVLLAQLVDLGTITQAEADQFSAIHDRLIEAGLMQ